MREKILEPYVGDLGLLLRERALDVMRIAHEKKDTDEAQFARGRLMGLTEALSLMRQQAIAFGIDPSIMHLKEDPEPEFLSPWGVSR